ncbi:VOC family protein [Sphingomonas gilva]|uniref:VOC family protein n=1 Tax=Sphingomonas gilva TaxID=2305907 RepID=A0A396RL81_9SPHN|nr:VOC family protein [Sphingomonas gilva]RHW17077.1 VOC family protein [Sphingomonas gilva]
MLDHFGFRVADLARSRRFYDATMGAIGLAVIDNSPTSFLIGRSAEAPIPFLWIGTDRPVFWREGDRTSASPLHVAFSAADLAAVDAFHEAGLAAGGTDNGAPGPRGGEAQHYYAAFLIDPDGNSIEAGFREMP